MNKWKQLLPTAVALAFSSQAFAQADDKDAQIIREEKVWVQEIHERDAEMDRQLIEAERRMAEAARQIAELTSERLPHAQNVERRIEIISDDKPRLGVTIGGNTKGAVKGVAVIGVTPGSAADDAGLRSGDTIIAINGESLAAPNVDEATERLLDFMRGVENGDTLEIGYLRDGKSGEVEVEPKPIAPQVFAFSGDGLGFVVPDAPEVSVLPVPGAPGAPRGMVFRWQTGGWGDMELIELNEGLGKYFGTDQGLLVVSAPETITLQLEDGDVIQKIDGREPSSVRHALRILGSYQAGESLEIEIMRNKKRKTLDVQIPSDLSSSLVPEVMVPSVKPARVPAPPAAELPPRPTERT
ncbi:MAG: PDZ domain-containing protein [Woeseiaceae bacterium]